MSDAGSRAVLVATRTKLINHARGTIKSVGERLPPCAAPGFARNTRELIPADLKPALEPVYECLLRIEEQIRELEQTIERVAERYPDVAVVSQIHGVGTLTALVYILTIDDKDRFAQSRMAERFWVCDLARTNQQGRSAAAGSGSPGRSP